MENLTELILLQIKSITKDMGGFVASLLSDDLTHDQQINFGHRLVDLAELILERAKNPTMAIEGTSATATTIIRPNTQQPPQSEPPRWLSDFIVLPATHTALNCASL